MKLNKTKKISFAGIAGCAGMLGLLAVAMLCPMRSEGASAVDCTADSSDPSCLIATAAADVGVNVAPMISMGLTPNVEIDVTPTADGAFQTGTASMNVSTNSASGYSVYMKTGNGKNTLSGTGSNTSTIGPVANNATQASFAKNSWGYNLSPSSTSIGAGTQYKPVPTTTTSAVTTGAGMTGTYNLTFATKVGTDLPTDQYTNSVVVSAVANPTAITKLTQLNYMQEMTSAICAGSSEGDTKQLVDTRDGNKYYVAKMKDGNCWMTQNLALDITTAGLKASDTDISVDWNSSSQYPPKATEYAVPTSGDTSQTNTLSWNLSGQGKNQWVLGTPTKTTSCGDVTDISTCTKVGFVKIDDTWSPTFQAQNGTWTGTGDYAGQTTYIAADPANKTYDPHYLIGNYYQWNTATAGTGGTITNQDAEGSVCPKGWELPSSGDSAASPSTTKNTFARLLSKYGVASSLTGTVDGVNYNIAEAPLYFVRSGSTNIDTSKLRVLGQGGDYWAGTPYSNPNDAYRMSFNNARIGTANTSLRWDGYPLRCVAE